MSSNEFLSVAYFSLVLHQNATAAAKRLETVLTEIAMEVIEFTNSSMLDHSGSPLKKKKIVSASYVCPYNREWSTYIENRMPTP